MTAPTIVTNDQTSSSDSEILSAAQKAVSRLHGLGNVYQVTDRILSSGKVDVRVEYHELPVAAWTNGTTITVNAREINSVDAASVERMNGLNAHELAHVLYTPRRGTSLVTWVIDNGYHRAFNILEDQRIETLLTARYPSTAPWLSATIARWVLSDESAKETGYLFVRGRKFLSGRLRGALRAEFSRQDLLPEIDSILDEYRTLVFGQDYDRARGLIERFNVVLSEVEQTQDENNPQGAGATKCPHSHGERPEEILNDGRPSGVSSQRNDADRADDGEPEEVPPAPQSSDDDDEQDAVDDPQNAEDDESEDDWDDESEEDGAGGSGDEDESGEDTDGSGQPGDRGQPGDTSQSGSNASESDDAQDGEPSDGVGNGPGSDRTLEDVAQAVLDEIRNDSEVRDDIRRTQRQIQAQGGADILGKSNWKPRSPLPEYARLLGGLRKSLTRLVAKADPGWESRQSSGRVNALRWAQERDLDTAFDLWDEGVHDAVDMEVVILIDESGSMHNVIEAAANAMWVVKRALDRIGASTTVIGFDNDCRTLYHRRDKANGQVRYSFHSGGTDPTDGLQQAAQIFASSRRTQKILIMLTDGDWYNRHDDQTSGDEYIARFNSNGVTTALGYIDSRGVPVEYVNGHGCALKATVSGTTLVTFVSTIVSTAIKARLRGR